MTSETPKPNDALVVRWLAISGAAGAAISSALSHWLPNQLWQSMTLATALLAVAGVAGLWRAHSKRSRDFQVVANTTGQQKREVSALQEELAAHREMERELTLAKQTAESAMMAKGEFLATMSHEIRTPLNGIIPMLDIMMTAPLAPDHKDIVRTAFTSAKQMLRIVDDILDYSKLEANKLTLETTSFNLRELCDSVIFLMERAAENKNLRLNLQIDNNVRLPVRGDPVRLRQVLTNLISNAIKFTERGSIQLLISRKSESRTQHELRIEARDTGIGISKQGIQQLFRPFSQADASTTRIYGGTGLGLVICKRIIDLMGGTMGVESEPNRGSTFWINVPMLKASGDIQGQRSDLNGARILLLSTDANLRQRLKPAAVSWGAQLTETDTTQEALAQLRTGVTRGGTWSYDLLLVDMNSVRSTAIALHRNLRRSLDLDDLRVVYLTGNEALPTELESTPQQAVAITRVMAANEMRNAITQFLSARPVADSDSNNPEAPAAGEMQASSAAMPAPVAAAIPAPTLSQPAPVMPDVHESTPASNAAENNEAPKKLRGHLLLVEDNPVNLMVAQRLISMLGLDCETAENGQIAIDRMMSGHLDLVLMDCQMPIKDGYTATQEWREYEINNGLPRIPIVAMTANAMAGDRQKCLDAGMDDYLTKPVDRRILESTLARWLQTKNESSDIAKHTAVTPSMQAPIMAAAAVSENEAAIHDMAMKGMLHSTPSITNLPPSPPSPIVAPVIAPVVAPIATPAPPQPAPAPVSSVKALPVLAPEIIEELKAMMGDEYITLVKLFLEDAPKQILQLETAAANNDIAGMIGPAHTLKSSSANLGALALAGVSKRIELGARASALLRPTVAVLLLSEEFKKAKLALNALLK
jgi:signal transduction histidine kinase/DNA-binding response OmpR family regulator/HPt (histidine-containing phosphotransfer) domain-containing protein